MKLKLFYLLVIFTGKAVICQETETIIDSIAKKHFEEPSNAGLSIGIIENGITKDYYFGGKYTNQLKDTDSTTLFEIGSVTKLYTAFILGSLETEKKLNRQDLLSKYLPKEITSNKAWANKIRLIDLATHTSGLPEFDNTKSLMTLEGFDENNPYGMFTDNFILKILKNTQTIDEYGKINYSNFGIGVLGYAMAASMKTDFNDLFKTYIIEKLNLNSTFLKVNEENLTQIAIPHRKTEVMPLIQLAGLSPAGSIKTNMPDLLKFLNHHLQPSKAIKNTVDIVLENQLKQGETPIGLGWGIHTIKNTTVYFHSGGTYGSSSIVIIIPSKNSAVAILSNNSTENQLTSYALKIANKLIE